MIKQAIAEINALRDAGIIDNYAIGGAVAATFYLEPSATLDLDIFVALRSEPGKVLLTLTPIYDFLLARGHVTEGEYIVIEDWPVQFLPPTGQLIEDALSTAVETDIDGTIARVMKAEYLAAIALQLGRTKDNFRLMQFVESGVLEPSLFDDIIKKHGLQSAWSHFSEKYLNEI